MNTDVQVVERRIVVRVGVRGESWLSAWRTPDTGLTIL